MNEFAYPVIFKHISWLFTSHIHIYTFFKCHQSGECQMIRRKTPSYSGKIDKCSRDTIIETVRSKRRSSASQKKGRLKATTHMNTWKLQNADKSPHKMSEKTTLLFVSFYANKLNFFANSIFIFTCAWGINFWLTLLFHVFMLFGLWQYSTIFNGLIDMEIKLNKCSNRYITELWFPNINLVKFESMLAVNCHWVLLWYHMHV